MVNMGQVSHTGAAIQTVHVALILLLAIFSFEPLIADTLGHIPPVRCVAGDCDAYSPILTNIPHTGLLLPHQSDVAESPGEPGRAVAELPIVESLAGPPVHASSPPITHHVVTQLSLTLSTSVPLTKAPTLAILSDTLPPVPAVDCEALVPLALPPAVHVIEAPALRLPGLKMAGTVVQTLESFAGLLLNTRRT